MLFFEHNVRQTLRRDIAAGLAFPEAGVKTFALAKSLVTEAPELSFQSFTERDDNRPVRVLLEIGANKIVAYPGPDRTKDGRLAEVLSKVVVDSSNQLLLHRVDDKSITAPLLGCPVPERPKHPLRHTRQIDV